MATKEEKRRRHDKKILRKREKRKEKKQHQRRMQQRKIEQETILSMLIGKAKEKGLPIFQVKQVKEYEYIYGDCNKHKSIPDTPKSNIILLNTEGN